MLNDEEDVVGETAWVRVARMDTRFATQLFALRDFFERVCDAVRGGRDATRQDCLAELAEELRGSPLPLFSSSIALNLGQARDKATWAVLLGLAWEHRK